MMLFLSFIVGVICSFSMVNSGTMVTFLMDSKEAGRNRVTYDRALAAVAPTEITEKEREVLYRGRRYKG